MDRLSISLNDDGKMIRAGQVLTGKIKHNNHLDIPITELYIECIGECKVVFEDKSHRNCFRNPKIYSSTEPLLNQKTVVRKCVDGSPFNLPGGIQTIVFSMKLPENIPSSFCGPHGSISYRLKATIERPFAKPYSSIELPFNVVAVEEVSQMANATSPTQSPLMKTWRLLGPIRAKMWLDQRGFVAGQDIPIDAQISNKSGWAIEKCRVQLVQKVSYRANSPDTRWESTTKVLNIEEWSCGKGSQEWRKFLTIPADAVPSRLNHCSLIDVNYEIQLVVEQADLLSSSMVVPLSIVIGTPLCQNV